MPWRKPLRMQKKRLLNHRMQFRSRRRRKKREKQKNLLITVGVAAIIIIAAACAFVFLTPQVATTGDRVSVYYTVAFDNGTVFDSNMNGTPLEFTLGNKSVITGVEKAVTGMSINQIKTVTIPYTDAYGAYDPGLVQTLNRTGPLANTHLCRRTILYSSRQGRQHL